MRLTMEFQPREDGNENGSIAVEDAGNGPYGESLTIEDEGLQDQYAHHFIHYFHYILL